MSGKASTLQEQPYEDFLRGIVGVGLIPHESITETPDPPAVPFQQGHKGWPIGIFPRSLDCQLFVGDVGRAHCRDHT
jgi:hypothetical protein